MKLKRVTPRFAVFASGLAFAQVASAIGPTNMPSAPLAAPSMIVQPEVSAPTRLNVTFRSGGQMVSERGEITLTEHDDGTFTVLGDGVFIEESDGGVEIERGRFQYEITASTSPNITLVQGVTGDWVAIGNSPLQVLIFSESPSANEEWTLQVRNLLLGSVSVVTGGINSNRDELGETNFFTALATIVMMQEATGGCDPSFKDCNAAAQTACKPDRHQMVYTCNPETGEVHCEWTCHSLGGGGSGGN